ncbi:MAG: hypothetical protein EXR72_19770 [Myxococcales bacterium]|nr:hypothetical protein [Myxococcales bacterium]
MARRHDPSEFQRVFGETLDDATSGFEALGARYMLIGGLAVGIRSRERATRDVDFSLAASPAETDRLIAAMAGRGYSSRLHGAAGPGAVVRFHRVSEDGIDRWIDVLVAGTEFEEEALGRALPVRFLGRDLRVATAEDLIVFKLIAGRLQDLADVGALIEDNAGALDQGYLDRKSDEWGVREALDRVRAAVGG